MAALVTPTSTQFMFCSKERGTPGWCGFLLSLIFFDKSCTKFDSIRYGKKLNVLHVSTPYFGSNLKTLKRHANAKTDNDSNEVEACFLLFTIISCFLNHVK